MAMARRMWRRCAGRGSWLSVRRWRMAAKASPGRAATLRTMAWLTAKLDVSGSGGGGHQPLEGRLAPGHEPLRRLLADDLAPHLGVVAGLGQRPFVLDDVLRRLHDHRTGDVEPGPPGPPGDLVELPGRQRPDPLPVVLRQRGEHHRADRDVDPDAEGVGAADHLEEPGLGQALHQPPVLGQHPGVVDADAVADVAGQRLAEPGGEPEPADELGDPVLLLPGADVDAHERLGPLDRRRLREVHDVDRRLRRGQELLDGLLHRRRAGRSTTAGRAGSPSSPPPSAGRCAGSGRPRSG